jgi:hypothetical protein
MKKILLTAFLALGVFTSNAQSDFYPALANNNATSTGGRAPQAAAKGNRAVYLITATELADAGYNNGNVLNAIGFNYAVASEIAVSSTTFNMYIENTAETTNSKSTNWDTAIAGMTNVRNDNITIPAATGLFFINVDAFTYTGGGLYIAFDYQNTGTLATTANRAWCNSSLAASLKGAASTSAVPTTIAASAFRPQTNFGFKVDCPRPEYQSFAGATSTAVELKWGGTGSRFDLEYGVDGFTQGAGTTISGITPAISGNTSLTQVIQGLTPSTVYQFYVRTDCGSGKTSVWKGPYPFYTAFDAADPSYTTGFETYDFPFLGWKADAAANNTYWFLAAPGAGNALVKDGNSTILSYNSTVAASTARVYSRGVNLKAGTVTVKYSVSNDISATSTGSADYELSVGNDQTVAAQTTTLKSETGLTNKAMEDKTVTYTVSQDGVYYFSFLNKSAIEPTASQYHGIAIDAFSVEQTTLSNNEFLSSQFSVSPNPAKNVVNIANGDNMFVNNVTVTDLNGRTVKNVSFDNVANVQVNVSDLASGLYLMNITSDKGTATKKFVKN